MCVEQKVSCSCTCPPNSFERSDHIVFGFPNRARARFLVQSAPLGWHKSMALCRSWSRICTSRMTCVAREPTPTHSVRNVPAREGALHKFFVRARTIWGNPKLWPLRSNACAFLRHLHFLFHTEPPITRVWDRSDLAQNDGNMSTRENRELWGETKQHRGMEDFLVRRIRSRNEVPLTLICCTSSEISQRGRIM